MYNAAYNANFNPLLSWMIYLTPFHSHINKIKFEKIQESSDLGLHYLHWTDDPVSRIKPVKVLFISWNAFLVNKSIAQMQIWVRQLAKKTWDNRITFVINTTLYIIKWEFDISNGQTVIMWRHILDIQIYPI